MTGKNKKKKNRRITKISRLLEVNDAFLTMKMRIRVSLLYLIKPSS